MLLNLKGKLLLLLLVFSFGAATKLASGLNPFQAVSKTTPGEENAASRDLQTNKTLSLLSSLPFDVLRSIAELSDDNSSAKLGIVSKEFNRATESRNQRNRLLQIMKHCGSSQYLRLTSNGHYIFRKNVYNAFRIPTPWPSGFIVRETLCVRALTSNIRVIGDKLTELTITLPNAYCSRSRELSSKTNAYLEALDALFLKKSSFEKLTVVSLFNSCDFLSSEVEKRILKLLSQLTITFIDIQFQIRNPKSFVNPSIKKLRSHRDFFMMKHFPGLSGLRSIIFPFYLSKTDQRRFDFQNEASQLRMLRSNLVGHSNFLQMARLNGVKELALPISLIPEVLSEQYDVEEVTILGEDTIFSDSKSFLNAMMFTTKKLTGLSFHKNLYPSLLIQNMSSILQKFKPSLVSLSFNYQDLDPAECGNLLDTFLFENTILNQLDVISQMNLGIDFNYLERAINLSSYSFEGLMTSNVHLQSLLNFIASHHSLQTISLKFKGSVEESTFFEFYEKLVVAIQKNYSITRLELFTAIKVRNLNSSIKLFAEKTKPLFGRDLVLNSISADQIVSDLPNGLPDGLRWDAFRGSYVYQASHYSDFIVIKILELN